MSVEESRNQRGGCKHPSASTGLLFFLLLRAEGRARLRGVPPPRSPDQQRQRGADAGHSRHRHQHVPDRRLRVRHLEKLHKSVLQKGNEEERGEPGGCEPGGELRGEPGVAPPRRSRYATSWELTQPLLLSSQSRCSASR